jgi:hypothetical protein
MSENIDNLRNEQGNVRGYFMGINQARELGIRFEIDENFRSVGRGIRIAMIWNGSAFQWVTFDDMTKLVWNLSGPINERNQAIDDESARLLVGHGDFFEVRNLPRKSNR